MQCHVLTSPKAFVMNSAPWSVDISGVKWRRIIVCRVSWERMAMPKMNWGLGFRNLNYFTIAMLARQAWPAITILKFWCWMVVWARFWIDVQQSEPRQIFCRYERFCTHELVKLQRANRSPKFWCAPNLAGGRGHKPNCPKVPSAIY